MKKLAYNSIVLPHLEYSCQVLDEHIENDIKKIDSVQRRAAYYVTNRCNNINSPSEMQTNFEWKTMQQRCTKICLKTMYNIFNSSIKIPCNQYLIPVIHCTNTNVLISRTICLDHLLLSSFVPKTIIQ